MTREELRSLIPLNDDGVPRNPRLKEIDRLLSSHLYNAQELALFEEEINLIANRRKVRDAKN